MPNVSVIDLAIIRILDNLQKMTKEVSQLP